MTTNQPSIHVSLKNALQNSWENHLVAFQQIKGAAPNSDLFHELRPLSEWMQLDPEVFPLPQSLISEQIKELTSSLAILYQLYAYEIVLPQNLTESERYFWMVCALNSQAPLHFTLSGQKPLSIYVCQKNPEHCPFTSRCMKDHCYSQNI